MKKYSFQRWSNSLLGVAFRFPSLVIIILVAIYVAVKYIYTPYSNRYSEQNYILILLICNIALVLGLTLDVLAESRNWSKALKTTSRALVFLFGAGLFYVLNPYQYETDIYRIVLLCLGFHFLFSSLIFMRKDASVEMFWEFNKRVFLGILQSALFSAVLYIGIALTAASLKLLFDVSLSSKFYGTLAVLIFVGFNTLMFLSTVPKYETLKNAALNYPKGLKVFTSYILTPLIGLYTFILLMYELRILILREFPNGYIAYMVLAFAICGILAFLLLFPIRNNEKWTRLFYRGYFFVMIPILIIMWISVGMRIEQYGITEARYCLAGITAWLTGIAIYFTIQKQPNIKWVSFSLAVMALLFSFGPLSASFMAKQSQTKALEKMIAGSDTVYYHEIEEKVNYLAEHFGAKALEKWIKVDEKDLLADGYYSYEKREMINDSMLVFLQDKPHVVQSNYDNAYESQMRGRIREYLSTRYNDVIITYGAKYIVELSNYNNFKEVNQTGIKLNITEDNILEIHMGDSICKENKSAWVEKRFEESNKGNLDETEENMSFWMCNNQFRVFVKDCVIEKNLKTKQISITSYSIRLFVF